MRITVPLCVLSLTSFAAAQWTQVSAPNAPSPRIEPQMVFDGLNNRTVLFGGADTSGFPPTGYGDTWVFDGVDWSNVSPATSPPGRYFGGMAYNPTAGKIVLYGGLTPTFFGANYLDDTWEFDVLSDTWTQVTTANSPGSLIGNPGVGEVSMAYDVAGQSVVMFGGELFQGIVAAPAVTLEYDGIDWVQTSPAVSPPRRSQAAMCSAPTLLGVLMFGGTNFNNPPGPAGEIIWDDTWLYESTTDTWTQLATTGPAPTSRAGASLEFDSATGLYVLHGGYTTDPLNPTGPAVLLSDTWVFDGTSWAELTNSTAPTAPLARFASAGSPGGHPMIFGGSTAFFGTLNNNTWRFGAAASDFGAGCAGTWGVPSLQATSAPTLGGSLDLTAVNLDPAATNAFLAIGWSNTSSALGPLPFDPSVFGFGTGCDLLTSGDLGSVLMSASGGTGTFSLAVPSAMVLVGIETYFQCGSIDAGATGGFAFSNGVAGMFGY